MGRHYRYKKNNTIPIPPRDTHLWDWYDWSELYNKHQLQTLCEHIENNYSGVEDLRSGAYNSKNEPIQNISNVKLISLGEVKPFIGDLIEYAFNNANHYFGYTTFGPYDNMGVKFSQDGSRFCSRAQVQWVKMSQDGSKFSSRPEVQWLKMFSRWLKVLLKGSKAVGQ